MKFLIDDWVLDTTTSTLIAYTEGYFSEPAKPDAQTHFVMHLYRSPKGRYWVYEYGSVLGQEKPIETHNAHIVTASEAVAWIRENNAVIVNVDSPPMGLELPEAG